MGKLHPEEEMRIGLKDVYVCELELDKVISSVLNNEVLYQEISKYPSVKRDIAIVIDKEINASEVIKVIKNDNQKLLKDVEIFDLYTDEKMGNNKSLALTLEFSSDNRTLETKEVDKQIDKILESLKVKLNAELRS
jgi:phenylalanyl-tRNA synthetase beta chain